MGVKAIFALVLALCFCAFGFSTPVVKKCENMTNGALMEEDCEDGTGASSVPGEADNIFVGFDIQGRRVFKIAGNDTCFIDTDPAPMPDYVTEATMDQTKTPELVTDQAVLDSVKEWCTGEVYVLVADDNAVNGDRRKRRTCVRLRCLYFIYKGRLYRHCRVFVFSC